MKTPQNVRVCTPLCAPTLELIRTSARHVRGADFVELRLDCLAPDQLQQFSTLGPELIRELSTLTIVTLRDPDQGGHHPYTRDQRREFWRTQLQQTDSWFDIEYDLVKEFAADESLSINWSGVICSHHDFKGTPDNLRDVFESLANTPARVVKIAVAAHEVVDCLPLFQLLDLARQRQRDLIAIAMNDAGIATRILGPSRGSFLTFAAQEESRGTAPGQLTLQDLHSIYHIDQITSSTAITGLVGSSVMHSVSPHMHNEAWAAVGFDGVYLPFQVRDVVSFFHRMVHPRTRELDWNLKGLSITAPHKAAVMECLDWIEPKAVDIGAVNTISVVCEKLFGYNTDAEGFMQPLNEKLQSIARSRIAVLGAGGAASAVVWALKNSDARVCVFGRDSAKAKQLAEQFGCEWSELPTATFKDFDVVVNATPLGSFGKQSSETPATAEQLHGVGLVYDLIYNPIETRLLREAAVAGCQTLGGLPMLINQALLQFEIWTGSKSSYSIMNDAALHRLALNSTFNKSQTQ